MPRAHVPSAPPHATTPTPHPTSTPDLTTPSAAPAPSTSSTSDCELAVRVVMGGGGGRDAMVLDQQVEGVVHACGVGGGGVTESQVEADECSILYKYQRCCSFRKDLYILTHSRTRHTHTQTLYHARSLVGACARTHARAGTHTHTQHTHTHTHTQTHAHTHTYTHTRTHPQSLTKWHTAHNEPNTQPFNGNRPPSAPSHHPRPDSRLPVVSDPGSLRGTEGFVNVPLARHGEVAGGRAGYSHQHLLHANAPLPPPLHPAKQYPMMYSNGTARALGAGNMQQHVPSLQHAGSHGVSGYLGPQSSRGSGRN